MIQKRIGNLAEKQVLEYLRQNGYWCHLFAQKTGGQPCDIIAVKNNDILLIDAKHTSTGVFNYSRIEPNQASCFDYAMKCGITKVGFAIVNQDTIKWLPYTDTKKGSLKKIIEMEDFQCVLK